MPVAESALQPESSDDGRFKLLRKVQARLPHNGRQSPPDAINPSVDYSVPNTPPGPRAMVTTPVRLTWLRPMKASSFPDKPILLSQMSRRVVSESGWLPGMASD